MAVVSAVSARVFRSIRAKSSAYRPTASATPSAACSSSRRATPTTTTTTLATLTARQRKGGLGILRTGGGFVGNGQRMGASGSRQPAVRMFAAGGGADAIEAKIKELNAEHGVVIYSKSWCPYCSRAKGIFDQLGTEYFALELGEIEEGRDVQDALSGITGIRTVPQVFVGGSLWVVGGSDGWQHDGKGRQTGPLAKQTT